MQWGSTYRCHTERSQAREISLLRLSGDQPDMAEVRPRPLDSSSPPRTACTQSRPPRPDTSPDRIARSSPHQALG